MVRIAALILGFVAFLLIWFLNPSWPVFILIIIGLVILTAFLLKKFSP